MTLRDLLIQKLNALYDIEHNLLKALAKLAKAAHNKELTKVFLEHLTETKTHVKRLEEAHRILGVKPKKLKSDGVRGIAKDAQFVIEKVKPVEARSVGLAKAARYAEHFEIAGYMSAIEWASELGEDEVATLLSQTLEEEKNADQKLEEVGKSLDKALLKTETKE